MAEFSEATMNAGFTPYNSLYMKPPNGEKLRVCDLDLVRFACRHTTLLTFRDNEEVWLSEDKFEDPVQPDVRFSLLI